MVETIVGWFWVLVAIYAALGVAFAVPFLARWSGRIDPSVKAGTGGFRVVAFPATVALWPVLARKAFRARRGGASESPDGEWPLRPTAQRRLHGLAFGLIVVVVPLVCGAALWSRPRIVPTVVELDPGRVTYASSITHVDAAGLPIRAAVRTGRDGRELELDVAKPLEEPVVAVYWSPVEAPNGIGPDAIFLGSIWGPARLVFPLPAGTVPGVLTFIALAGDQRVLETLDLP